MRIRFQADADLDGRILKGVKRRAPEIDIRATSDAGFIGVQDPDVLRIAAETGRILVSQDRRTMPMHFARHAPWKAVQALSCFAKQLQFSQPLRNWS